MGVFLSDRLGWAARAILVGDREGGSEGVAVLLLNHTVACRLALLNGEAGPQLRPGHLPLDPPSASLKPEVGVQLHEEGCGFCRPPTPPRSEATSAHKGFRPRCGLHLEQYFLAGACCFLHHIHLFFPNAHLVDLKLQHQI